MIRVRRCPCDACGRQGRRFWLVSLPGDLDPIILLSFRDAINVADNYAHRRAA